MLMSLLKIILEFYSLIGLNKMKKTAIIVFAVVLQSCSSQLYIPVSNAGEIAIENLQKGRRLYVDNCASCHQLFLPQKYDNSKWQKNLDEMQIRSKITDEQKKLIYEYLVNAPK